MRSTLSCDYLVIGAGALGMTFVDEMLTASDATFVMVDRHHLPGGHWNDAYPFVRLHQPSAFYGAGSKVLGSNRIDESGFNRGYYELASGAEVLSYFEQLMRERFLPSGRVQYFPLSEYTDSNRFVSLLSKQVREVTVRRRIVDATFFNTAVPSTQPPRYRIAKGVNVVTPNQLPSKVEAHRRFTIVGGGKTGMDVGVWLLQHGAAPEAIRWIVPRDSWLINRETVQPGDAFAHRFMDARARQLEACAQAKSVKHLFQLLEQADVLLRLDSNVTPTMYHNATIALGEIEALRTIGEIVRKGRVQQIEAERIILDEGEVDARPDDLYIDCSASALAVRDTHQVFEPGRITLQMIRKGLFCYSAAAIAHVEATIDCDEERNRLCPPMAMPDAAEDWLRLTHADQQISQRWTQDESLRQWMGQHRLTGANLRTANKGEPDPEMDSIKARMHKVGAAAMENLERLLTHL